MIGTMLRLRSGRAVCILILLLLAALPSLAAAPAVAPAASPAAPQAAGGSAAAPPAPKAGAQAAPATPPAGDKDKPVTSATLTGWSLLYALILISFFVLAQKSDVLRDSGPEPGSGARRPFSLARTQAAWWFLLVVGAYLFVAIH